MDKTVKLKLSNKERSLRKEYAKILRDRLVNTIESSKDIFQIVLSPEKIEEERKEYIRDQILAEAYNSLVWRYLSEEERYNTPYFESLLLKLKKEHPDLEVVNSMNTFVRWSAFNKDDIDTAFTNDVAPLDLHNGS